MVVRAVGEKEGKGKKGVNAKSKRGIGKGVHTSKKGGTLHQLKGELP